jgi:ABC-type thiamine transport system substrate-binding protein
MNDLCPGDLVCFTRAIRVAQAMTDSGDMASARGWASRYRMRRFRKGETCLVISYDDDQLTLMMSDGTRATVTYASGADFISHLA